MNYMSWLIVFFMILCSGCSSEKKAEVSSSEPMTKSPTKPASPEECPFGQYCGPSAPASSAIPKIPAKLPDNAVRTDYGSLELIKESPVGNEEKEIPQVFHIECTLQFITSIGTAFLVEHNNKKYVVTANHIVESANQIRLFHNYGVLDMKIKKYSADQKHDLAILLVETNELGYQLHDRLIFKGDFDIVCDEMKDAAVTIYGYPGSWGFRKSDGLFYSAVKLTGEVNLLAKNPSKEGMSGGPWLVNGKVVGIHTKRITFFEKEVPIEYAAATPVNVLYDLIDQLEKK